MPPNLRRIVDGRVPWSVVLALFLVSLVFVPTVSAHAALIGSTPESGEHVAEPPEEVTLRFSASVQLATVSVISPDGKQVAGPARIDPQDQSVVHVPLEAGVGNGTYIVKWKVLSADGHTVSGSFFFVVGEEPPTREQLLRVYTQTTGEQSTNPAAPISRALLFGGLVVLVGAPITLLFVLYPLARKHEIPTTTAGRVTYMLFGGALLAVLVAATALAFVQLTASRSLTIENVQRFATTTSGVAWLVRTGVAVVLGLLTALVATKRASISTRQWLGALLGGGLLAQLTVSWTSHSAAVTGGLVGVLVDFGHLIGGALWVGGLVVLAVLAPRFLERATDASQVTAQLIRRFSVLAIAGVALVSATGLAIAAWHVPTVGSLSATLYGTALSVKVVLVLLVVGVGGLNRFVLHRRLSASTADHEGSRFGWPGVSIVPLFGLGRTSSRDTVRTFVRSVRLELVVLVVVLLLSGLITSIPTAASAVGADQSPNELVLESDVDGVTLTVSIIPGQAGPNVVTVNVTKNGEPVQTQVPVSVSLSQPWNDVTLPQVELDKVGPGSYSTVMTIPPAGMWMLHVTTWTEQAHVVEKFMIHVASDVSGPMAHSHMSHGVSASQDTGGWFTTVLQFGAVAIAIFGIGAVSYEMLGMGLLRREG